MTVDVWVHEPGQIEMTRAQHWSVLQEWSARWRIAPDRIVLPRWGGAPFPFPPEIGRVPTIIGSDPAPILAHPVWWIIEESWRRPLSGEDPRSWMLRTYAALETERWIVDGATCGDHVLRALQTANPVPDIWDAIYWDASNPTLNGAISLPHDAEEAAEVTTAQVHELDAGWTEAIYGKFRDDLWADTHERLRRAKKLGDLGPPEDRESLTGEIEVMFDLLEVAERTLGETIIHRARDRWEKQADRLVSQDTQLAELEGKVHEWLASEANRLATIANGSDVSDIMSLIEPDDQRL